MTRKTRTWKIGTMSAGALIAVVIGMAVALGHL
jgi:hypothetical protein